MHDLFPDWYRIADLKPDAETLKNRWQVIGEFRKVASTAEWLDIVRISLGYTLSTITTASQFAQRFKTSDSLFSVADETELRVLAGAAIVHGLGTPDLDADTVSLALASAYFGGRGPRTVFPAVMEAALAYVRNEGIRVREESDELAALKARTPLKDLRKIELATVVTAPGWQIVEDNFQSIVSWNNDLLTALRKLQGSVSGAVEGLKATTTLGVVGGLKEEVNILWWIFSERSRDLELPLAAVGFPAAALVLPKEAADLTVMLPGPPSIENVLAKGLDNCGEVPETVRLRDVVNAADRSWREKWIATIDLTQVEDFTPIHRAVRISLSTNEATTWIPAYDKTSSVKAKSSLAPLAFSSQVYTESLLVRSLVREP
jgi:hypothetical protein